MNKINFLKCNEKLKKCVILMHAVDFLSSGERLKMQPRVT